LEAKYLLLILFGLGGLAAWAGSEAVLPAYVLGMLLAGSVGRNHALIRRLRTLTLGLMTPFYFIRAGSYISIPALVGLHRQGGKHDDSVGGFHRYALTTRRERVTVLLRLHR